MFFLSIIFLTNIILSIQSLKPALKLTFVPDEKYYAMGRSVEILCEIINPTEDMDPPQLWHVDFKNIRRTQISRTLINSPHDDSPDVFKQNKQKRIEHIKRNHIRIRYLKLEDSAQYECDCPDCEEPLAKQTKNLLVMKLTEPKWHIEPGWPLQENTKTTIKCTADDFYPYISYKVIRHHHDISSDGRTTALSTSNMYPHKFSWEATITPKADWHNTTLRCVVLQGNTEQHVIKCLDVLFTSRFLECHIRQYIDSTKDNAIIKCSYSGNPQPKLLWLRQTDEQPITSYPGVIIHIKDDYHGKYTSTVTFNREKLVAMPLTKNSSKMDNSYQELLNNGFIVKLILNNEEKGSKSINITTNSHTVQAQTNLFDNSATKTVQNLSKFIVLFSFLFRILYII